MENLQHMLHDGILTMSLFHSSRQFTHVSLSSFLWDTIYTNRECIWRSDATELFKFEQ